MLAATFETLKSLGRRNCVPGKRTAQQDGRGAGKKGEVHRERAVYAAEQQAGQSHGRRRRHRVHWRRIRRSEASVEKCADQIRCLHWTSWRRARWRGGILAYGAGRKFRLNSKARYLSKEKQVKGTGRGRERDPQGQNGCDRESSKDTKAWRNQLSSRGELFEQHSRRISGDHHNRRREVGSKELRDSFREMQGGPSRANPPPRQGNSLSRDGLDRTHPKDLSTNQHDDWSIHSKPQ